MLHQDMQSHVYKEKKHQRLHNCGVGQKIFYLHVSYAVNTILKKNTLKIPAFSPAISPSVFPVNSKQKKEKELKI